MEKLKKEIQIVIDAYKSGDLLKAETICKELLGKNPKIAFLYNLIGLIMSAKNQIESAIEYYKKGLEIDPNYAMIYNNLGLIYFNKKNDKYINEAEECYLKSISINKNLPEPYTNLGSLYRSINKFDEAIASYKKALKINPKFLYAHHNIANIYIALGKFDSAQKHLNNVIDINSKFHLAHRTLSRLIKYKKNDKHLNDLEKIYKDIDDNDVDAKINIAFALGKANEDINDFGKSFEFYKTANLNFRKKINFSIKSEIKRFNDIKELFNDKLLKKYPNTGCKNSSPIFIVGMPRSGTTLVEQILSSHDDVYGGDEVDFIPQIVRKKFGQKDMRLYFNGILDFDENEFKILGEEYVSKIKKISNKTKMFTDKLPKNFESIGLIKLMLPNAKIIHCKRNSMDNCFSIFKNHFPGSKIDFAYDLNEICEYYNIYSELMNYWNNLVPGFIYNIKYENLILNTKTEIEKLLEKCNLPWSDNCLNFDQNKRPINTASDVQARKKIYSSSINVWKKYDPYLKEYFKKLF